MTSPALFRPSRSGFAAALLFALAALPQAGHAEWQDVEVLPVRYTFLGEDVAGNTLGRLKLDAAEHARQPNNLNHRLVNTPPDLPLRERRALTLAIDAARWTRFAEETLQDGDVMFRLGRARTHLFVNFSKVTAAATRSTYSHTGIFRWRDGVPEVIDITDSGVRVQTFAIWMREVDANRFAVHRLKPEYRDRIPRVLAFLEEQERLRPEFDFVFEPDNGKYYCNEMTELAFRSAGIKLSEAVPPSRFPGVGDVPVWIWLIKTVGGIRLSTPMYVVGNENYGMYASDKLVQVYSTKTGEPPTLDGLVVAALPIE